MREKDRVIVGVFRVVYYFWFILFIIVYDLGIFLVVYKVYEIWGLRLKKNEKEKV